MIIAVPLKPVNDMPVEQQAGKIVLDTTATSPPSTRVSEDGIFWSAARGPLGWRGE